MFGLGLDFQSIFLSLTTGVLSVTAPSGNLNNSIWHKVVVERHGNNVNVTVDRNSSGKISLYYITTTIFNLQSTSNGSTLFLTYSNAHRLLGNPGIYEESQLTEQTG